jgi:site-specific recombinase XerD
MKTSATTIRHPFFTAYLDHLRSSGRERTANTYRSYLAKAEWWLEKKGIAPERATSADLRLYQIDLSKTKHVRTGQPLATSTLGTAITVLKSVYYWLWQQGHLLSNPAASLIPPAKPRSLIVAKMFLSQQEAQAMIDTASALINEATPNTMPWALAVRNRALIALALASGRRCRGLVSLRLADIDCDRAELRVALEKSRTGRVLPLAGWAISAVQQYLSGPRSYLLGTDVTSPWLFVSQRAPQLCPRGFAFILDTLMAETILRNPDLTELASKRISTHSLRVSFAKLMHDHGCSIRSLNELMLHHNLTTTAAYTPTSVADLRRALLPCHPRG